MPFHLLLHRVGNDQREGIWKNLREKDFGIIFLKPTDPLYLHFANL